MLILAVCVSAQQHSSITGTVTDEAGAVIPGARVVMVSPDGVEVETTTDERGRFAIRVAPAVYTVRVSAQGFDEAVLEGIDLGPKSEPLSVALRVAGVTETVEVSGDKGVAAEPERNADALVLKEKDMAALPDDPDELAQALQELAGPGAGPGGGQFYIDGFSGGRLPPKSSIREIRINSNPFSAEYDRIGFGRIEVFTKPGSDRWRGQVFGTFLDESLDARNPFAVTKAPEQDRRYGANVSGPLGKRMSFFLDFEKRDEDESNAVAAVILDPQLNPVIFTANVAQPSRRTAVSPRVDIALNDRMTLVFRYDFVDDSADGQGVGGYALPSRATSSGSTQNILSGTFTFIVNPTFLSETKLQLVRLRSNVMAESGLATALNVTDSFFQNSAAGVVDNSQDRFELQQNFNKVLGNHTFRFGARVRGTRLSGSSTANYGGSYTFAGDVERDPVTGLPVPNADPISSLAQYQRTLQGLPGYTASQFTLTGGDPFASATQYDVGLFLQDDWRARPNFTLSYGLRYENQTNAGNDLNFAPRVGFAYAFNGPDGNPVTVVRGGFGIFYERIGEDLELNAVRYDGTRQQQYIVARPPFFPFVPTPGDLEEFALPSATRPLNAVNTPYQVQGSFSLERQLPLGVTASATYVWSRGVHLLRTRNINAPLPDTRVRPYGDAAGDIFSVEATGFSRRNQIRFNLSRRAGKVTLFANYVLGWVRSDTDGAGSQPGDSYDLAAEYGRGSDDSRHQVFVGGNYTGPWGLQISPFLVARSGRPYNITVGRDLNGDTVFTDRPSLASPNDADAILTSFGYLDPTPGPNEARIERNTAEGFSFVRLNLSVSKTFGFGGRTADPGGAIATGSQGGPRGGPGGGGRGGGGFGGGGGSDQRYSLNVSIRANNVLNQTNFANPSGVLSSPGFGIPNVALPARRIEMALRFSF